MGQLRRLTAVIPYRVHGRELEVVLVTSTNNGDWIPPKGRIEDGEQPWEAAAREAEEEAGVLGVVDEEPLGRCVTSGRNDGYLDVYAMRVSAVLDRWPEEELRDRRWMPLRKAVAAVRPEYRAALDQVRERLRLAPASSPDAAANLGPARTSRSLRSLDSRPKRSQRPRSASVPLEAN
jgi:8-oxo-dGTP pyrophosphatase MutT (NUDIX family)